MTRRTGELTSGFVRLDFFLTYTVQDAASRSRLDALCEGEWAGTRAGDSTWEICAASSPSEFEALLEPHLGPGDRAVFYYLADSKRLFRVVVSA